MGKDKKIKITWECFEFVKLRDTIKEFIRENNEFAYTIDDIFKLVVCPYYRITPFEIDIDIFPTVKRLCDSLVEKKDLYQLEIDGVDYYYYFRIGRIKYKFNCSILKKDKIPNGQS